MLIRYSDSCDAITNFLSLTVIPKSCTVSKPSAIFMCEERNTWRVLNYRWLPVPSEHIRDLVDFLIRSCKNHLLPYMVLAGDTDSKEKFLQLRWECLQDIYTFGILPLSSTISWVELEKKKKISTPWSNFDDTSKFCGEKYIGSSRLNIYRFSFASHLRMAHELSLKVYKVKACLLRLQCRVSSNI